MFTFRCHDTATDQNGMPYTIQARNYLMLSEHGERLYVQGGQVWNGENSPPIDEDDLPDWFFAQMRRQSPAARKEVGYQLPEDREAEADEALEKIAKHYQSLSPALKAEMRNLLEEASRIDGKALKVFESTPDMASVDPQLKIDSRASSPKTWACEACGKEIPTTHKGVHIGRLRRLGRCS